MINNNKYIIQPVRVEQDDGSYHYTWDNDLIVGISACDNGSLTNRGLFTARKLLAGTHIPILGYLPTIPRMSSINYSFSCNNILVDGHPSLHPYNNIASRGLSIAMIMNEPSSNKKPNVFHLGHWLVLGKTVPEGEELFVYYGDQYPRETFVYNPLTKCNETIKYTIGTRANLLMNESETKCIQSASANIQPRHKRMFINFFMNTIINVVHPKPFPLLSDWYIAGRRTGLGYSYNINDAEPRLEVRPSPWLVAQNECSSNLCRGLFVGSTSSFHKNEIVTTYSGPIIDHQTSLQLSCKTHLKTIMRQTYVIDGYKNPTSYHGLGQYINDVHNSGLTPNVTFQTVSGDTIIAQEHNNNGTYVKLTGSHECLIIALRDIGPGEELIVSIPDHRKQFLHPEQSYIINRQIEVAFGSLCFVRYRDTEDQPFIPALLSLIGRTQQGKKNEYDVRWFDTVEEYKSMEDYLELPFLPGWIDEVKDDIVYQTLCPGPTYVPYTSTYIMTTRDILVHGITLTPEHCIKQDLQEYIIQCPKLK
jgi:hypothetical protein